MVPRATAIAVAIRAMPIELIRARVNSEVSKIPL